MNLIASIGLDVAAVAIVLYCAHAATKKGFLRTVVQMIAYVAIVLAASFFSRACAPVIYDRIVEPMLLQEQPVKPSGNAALVSAANPGLLSVLEDGLHSLDEFFPDGSNPQDLADGLIEDLADATLRPLMISAISMIGFVLLFTVLSVAANLALSTLGVINYLPVVGTLNAALGCLVGILQGVLIVWVLGILLRGVLHIYPEGWWIFTPEVVNSTYLFRYFANPALLRG